MLRNFQKDSFQSKVYKEMYANQSLEFQEKMVSKYSKLNHGHYSIKQVLKLLDNFIDPSDPDVSLPNSIHAYQTAERIRKEYPENYQFQLCGLIHDLGKILYKFGEKSWAIVGDTYVLGCKIPESIVYKEHFPKDNLTKLGIYSQGCGVNNLKLSFGHDEYLYMVLKGNNHKLDEKYMQMIKFHSFYPWHTHYSYDYFNTPSDYNLMKNVQLLNKFDLYSKEDDIKSLCNKDIEGNYVIKEEIEEYYDNLLREYFPEKLNW